jgi:5'-phosphate synthase pdxT subunit
VAARQGDAIVVSFHPELTGDDRLHAAFLAAVSARRARRG